MEEDIDFEGVDGLKEDLESNNSEEESNLDSNIEESENFENSVEEMSKEDDANFGDMKLTEDESLANTLSQDLELYHQDHNPDHLFDYLNSLHTSFLQAMAISDAKPAEQAPAEMPAAEPAVVLEPAQDIAVLPAAQQVVVPAEISQKEMKIDLPKETAVDVRS